MFVVYEKGLFLKDNYRLEAEYDEVLSGEKEKFLALIAEWNEDKEKFLPEKVCGIFEEMRRMNIERGGTLRKKECYYVRNVVAFYENRDRFFCRLSEIPDEIAERIAFIHENRAIVSFEGKRYYVFFEKKIADAYKSLVSYDILPMEWPKECKKFLYKKAFDRKKLVGSFFAVKPSVYTLRPGFRRSGELLETYFFGIALNGDSDNFYLTNEEYLELYCEHYQDDIQMLGDKVCIMNYGSNLKYLEKLYQRQKIANSPYVFDVLNDFAYSVAENCRWRKKIYIIDSLENRMSILWENRKKTNRLLVITDFDRLEAWREYFPGVMLYTPENLSEELENDEESLEQKPITLVWDCRNIEHEKLVFLKFLLRFCMIEQEMIFLSNEFAESNIDYGKCEEVFYISDFKDEICHAKCDRDKIPRDSVKELLFFTGDSGEEEHIKKAVKEKKHVIWLAEHLELYKVPKEIREIVKDFEKKVLYGKASGEDLTKIYHLFLASFLNNMFMYKNGIHSGPMISSSETAAYFIKVENEMIPLGFLQYIEPGWKIKQRSRIYQWLEEQYSEWNQYLNETFVEFYAEDGEKWKRLSDMNLQMDRQLFLKTIFESESGQLIADEESMYIRLNEVVDIL